MATTAAPRYALFLAMPMGTEDIGVGQVLQAYKEVLAPFVQAYTIAPDKLHLTPPCVAAGGLPTLYDTVTGQRTGNGRTAATLAAMGSRLLSGAVPPAGTPATLRPPRPDAAVPSFTRPVAAPAGPGPQAPHAPGPAFQGVPASYEMAQADAAPAGGGARPMLLSAGSGRAGSGSFSSYARSGGHGMAFSEFSTSAAMESDLFAGHDAGFNQAIMPQGPLLAAPGAGDGGFRPPAEYGSAPPLVPEPADRREKRVGEADAEALAALRASRDQAMRAGGAGASAGASAGAGAGAGASAGFASAPVELTRSQERARDSGLMLTRPLPSAGGAGGGPGSMRPPPGVF